MSFAAHLTQTRRVDPHALHGVLFRANCWCGLRLTDRRRNILNLGCAGRPGTHPHPALLLLGWWWVVGGGGGGGDTLVHMGSSYPGCGPHRWCSCARSLMRCVEFVMVGPSRLTFPDHHTHSLSLSTGATHSGDCVGWWVPDQQGRRSMLNNPGPHHPEDG